MRCACLLAACALLATAHAAPAMRNPAFQEWNASGKPESWYVATVSGYEVARDCDAARVPGRCLLRLSGPPSPEATFQPLAQSAPPGDAAGHRLTLSGWIRTRDVKDGYAGLWLRVDGTSGVLALENMHREGPRGTTPWTRYQVTVPVPANARQVAFGVLFSGSGAAWFDELQLDVDADSVVARVEESKLSTPPRPIPGQALLDDAALALPAATLPAIPSAWKAQVRAQARPIRSLFSDDFRDLAFLAPLLEGRRVVQLGESGHGLAEFNWLKVRLVKYLHQVLGFDVIAFESAIGGCQLADTHVGRAAPQEVLRECTFSVWHTAETLPLFEYLEAARKTSRPLTLAGFDVQDSGTARHEVTARLRRYAALLDEKLAARVADIDAAAQPGLTPGQARAAQAPYEELATRLQSDSTRVLEQPGTSAAELAFVIRDARSRAVFADQLGKDGVERTTVRDKGMADNLDFLLDRAYPGRKVIVWAHNFHILKDQAIDMPRTMGTWVAERRGAEAYTIGIFMGRGVGAHNNRALYEIKAPPDATLEAILANGGWRVSFVDLVAPRRDPASWVNQLMSAREWGLTPVQLVPARSFDGLIYVDTVTPPLYR